MRKNEGRCSICKRYFDEDYVTHTCSGYDQLHRLQVTSKCCRDKLKRVIHIGLCGYMDPDDVDEAMKEHPLYEAFHKKKKVPELPEHL